MSDSPAPSASSTSNSDARRPYPADPVGEALRYTWLYDEHPWGADISVSEPDALQTRLQWQYKSDYAQEATRLADDLAAALPPAPDAGAVPPSGTTAPATWDGRTLENARHRLEFDPETGALVRWHDKALRCQLIDEESPFRLNQYWREQGTVLDTGHNPNWLPDWLGLLGGHVLYPALPAKQAATATAAPAPPQLTANGPDYAEVTVDTVAPGCRRLVQRVRLYSDDPGLEFINELDKIATLEKESGYFTFPFALRPDEVRLEVGGTPLRAETDQLPGACRDWCAVQRYAAVADEEVTVLLGTVDAPLVCIGGLTPECWAAQHPSPWPNGTLASWVFNNHWGVNYQARQGGRLLFRYRVAAHAGPFDAAVATRWAATWETAVGGALPGAAEDVLLEPGHVALLALKRAERGDEHIARVVEVAGRPATATLRLPRPIRQARRASLVETAEGDLPVRDGAVAITIEPYEIATVRFRCAVPPAGDSGD